MLHRAAVDTAAPQASGNRTQQDLEKRLTAALLALAAMPPNEQDRISRDLRVLFGRPTSPG